MSLIAKDPKDGGLRERQLRKPIPPDEDWSKVASLPRPVEQAIALNKITRPDNSLPISYLGRYAYIYINGEWFKQFPRLTNPPSIFSKDLRG